MVHAWELFQKVAQAQALAGAVAKTRMVGGLAGILPGAAVGAAGGALSGDPGTGALTGAAVGGLLGHRAVGKILKNTPGAVNRIASRQGIPKMDDTTALLSVFKNQSLRKPVARELIQMGKAPNAMKGLAIAGGAGAAVPMVTGDRRGQARLPGVRR